MRLKYPMWHWRRALTEEDCEKVVAVGDALHRQQAQVGMAKPEVTEARDSEVAWIPRDEEQRWIYDMLGEFVNEANDRAWGWALSDLEPIQYTVYKPGGHFVWHTDQSRTPRPGGMIRKVTAVVSLSGASDYEGGGFELEIPVTGPDEVEDRIHKMEFLRTRGAVLVFPSFLYHRVIPLTAGTRKSLVAWCQGPRFV